jgi:hypothetical protein
LDRRLNLPLRRRNDDIAHRLFSAGFLPGGAFPLFGSRGFPTGSFGGHTICDSNFILYISLSHSSKNYSHRTSLANSKADISNRFSAEALF